MISQGIGRENIQTLEPIGKIQMYKEEPIQLSTNHFVFCAQSSRSWLGKFNAWGWEEYGSQIWIWKATHFWKTCFWLLGQVNACQCMPKTIFTDTFCSLMQLELLGSSLHVLVAFSLFHSSKNPFFGCLNGLFFKIVCKKYYPINIVYNSILIT